MSDSPAPPVDEAKSAEIQTPGDSSTLSRLGYAQELVREMGGFSNFAVSFSIISVLTGCITTYSDAIGPGGPRAVGVGWPLVSLGTLFVAFAMAELASAFPTAGALYHWAALLGGAGWGWLTAVMNLVGQIAVVAAIDLGCARELGAVLGMDPSRVLFLFALIVGSHLLLNVTRVRLVAWLNDLSATVHIVGVLGIVGVLFFFRVQPLSFLTDHSFTTRADGDTTLGFLNGLILSMYTFTGYDASAHLSEETKDPARRAPFGIIASVVVSAFFGYALLVAITLAIHDLPEVARNDHAALAVMERALGPRGAHWGIGIAILAMWFCGLSSLTSASRTLYAFSRDGGVPFAHLFAKVSERFKTPANAAITIAASAIALAIVTSQVSAAAFTVVAQVATMGLYVSYALPIGLGVHARFRGRWTIRGPFTLGRLGIPIALVATLWTAFVLFVSSLPPNQLAGKILVGCLVGMGAFWFAFAKGRFYGPPVDLAAFESGRDRSA